MSPSPRQPPAEPDGAPRPHRRGYLVPGLIALSVLVVLALVVNFAGLTHRRPATLAGPEVATLLSQGIQARQGLSQPPRVTCPSSEPVRAGVAFRCSWHHGAAAPQPVAVTETGGGQFRFQVLPAGR